MYPDVVKLRRWYASPLGQSAAKVLQREVPRLIPLQPQRILHLGYGVPVAEALAQHGQHQQFLALPAQMGATWWPQDAANRTTLIWEHALPFTEHSFDWVILHHTLEFSAQAEGLMREVARCLAPNGQLLVIAPNRISPWSWREGTPLGRGHPYSAGQLKRFIENVDFTVHQQGKWLFQWPLSSRGAQRFAPWCERLGEVLWPWAGGWVWLCATPEQLGGRAVRTHNLRWPPLFLPKLAPSASCQSD